MHRITTERHLEGESTYLEDPLPTILVAVLLLGRNPIVTSRLPVHQSQMPQIMSATSNCIASHGCSSVNFSYSHGRVPCPVNVDLQTRRWASSGCTYSRLIRHINRRSRIGYRLPLPVPLCDVAAGTFFAATHGISVADDSPWRRPCQA